MPRLSNVLSTLVQEGSAGALAGERRTAAEMEALADRLEEPPEAFAGGDEVAAYLRHHFPPLDEPPEDLVQEALADRVLETYLDTWQPGETAVRPNEVYLHPDYVPADRAARFGKLDDLLGVSIPEDELDARNGLPFLTEAAVERVERAVARKIGGRRRDALHRVAEDGVPKPVVEDIDLDVKLAFDEQLGASVVNSASPPSNLATEAVGSLSTSMHFK
jgi:hypothetical protein